MSNFPSYISSWVSNEQIQTLNNRTKMSSGYSKEYDVYSKKYLQADYRILFSEAQLNTFFTWYENNNVGFFDITHPRTQQTESVRMIQGQFSIDPASSKESHYYLNFTGEMEL